MSLPPSVYPTAMLRYVRPLTICFALVVTTQASNTEMSSEYQLGQRLGRLPPLQLQHCGVTTAKRQQSSAPRNSPWLSNRARRCAWTLRGGQHGSNEKDSNMSTDGDDDLGRAEEQRAQTTDKIKIEYIASELRARTDDIAADMRARGEAIAADLQAKQEKITDELLRDRSPEAFGELGGHRSYDPTTAGMDVANRRSFFLGIRRLVLLVQVVELILACSWQAAFPYGGLAGFFGAGGGAVAIPEGAGGDVRGRFGLAVAALLGQAALYTILLVFLGCDRVVLGAVRLTGWEHGAAAAWVLVRALGAMGKVSHLVASVWLAGMAFLCIYFGRQL